MREPPPEVAAYLAALRPPHRAALLRLRAQVLRAAPMATEAMRAGMPAFLHEGLLARMGGYRHHCAFIPGASGVELARSVGPADLPTSKEAIRFLPDAPLPAALVRQIVKLRVAENGAQAALKARRAAHPASRAPGPASGRSARRPRRP